MLGVALRTRPVKFIEIMEAEEAMKIITRLNQSEEEKQYQEFLATWKSLEQGDIVRVHYLSDKPAVQVKDYYYLVVKAPRGVGEAPKYSFINLEKSAYRGSTIFPLPLTEIAFRELFAYSSKTEARRNKPRGTLAITKFEVVDATLMVDLNEGGV